MNSFTIELTNQDPLEAFTQLQKMFPSAFFFETRSSLKEQLETSIIGLVTDQILSARDFKGQFLNQLEKKISDNKVEHTNTIPYANGGAFGCIGYDLVSEIEPCLNDFGYLKKINDSGSFEGEILFTKNLIVFDHRANRIHIILNSKTDRLQKQKIDLSGILHILESKNIDLKKDTDVTVQGLELSRLKSLMGKDSYIQNVQHLKKHIQDGTIFQAVLGERIEVKSTAKSLDIFTRVRQNNPAAYCFYFNLTESIFFGASPEALVKVRNGHVETHPIAGTRPRGKNEGEDIKLEKELLENVKESAEHLMLVDLARNDIGRVAAPGTVKVTQFRNVMKLPNVMHLISNVEGQLSGSVSDLQALKACFPAGTLSGAPKIRAMQILSELEQIPRGLYGGAVVAFDFQGGMDSCIAIRSIEMKNDIAILRAGAGIVADSDPASEYQEIQDKLSGLIKAIALAETVEV